MRGFIFTPSTTFSRTSTSASGRTHPLADVVDNLAPRAAFPRSTFVFVKALIEHGAVILRDWERLGRRVFDRIPDVLDELEALWNAEAAEIERGVAGH
jgi:hypothetical protein